MFFQKPEIFLNKLMFTKFDIGSYLYKIKIPKKLTQN